MSKRSASKERKGEIPTDSAPFTSLLFVIIRYYSCLLPDGAAKDFSKSSSVSSIRPFPVLYILTFVFQFLFLPIFSLHQHLHDKAVNRTPTSVGISASIKRNYVVLLVHRSWDTDATGPCWCLIIAHTLDVTPLGTQEIHFHFHCTCYRFRPFFKWIWFRQILYLLVERSRFIIYLIFTRCVDGGERNWMQVKIIKKSRADGWSSMSSPSSFVYQ